MKRPCSPESRGKHVARFGLRTSTSLSMVLVATLALVASACSGSVSTTSPSQAASSPSQAASSASQAASSASQAASSPSQAASSPSQAASSASPGQNILIGGIGPLSAPGNVQGGTEMQWAEEQAISDINAAGGVLGRNLRLIFYDTSALPDVAAAAATRLVTEDHVVAVAGEFHSGNALAEIPVFSKAGTPVVFAETYGDAVTAGDPTASNLPANPPTIFRIAPSATLYGGFFTDWVVNGLHAKKVVQVTEATDYGAGEVKTLKAQLDQAGVAIAQVQVQLNQTDYSAIVSRLAQENPDADVVFFDQSNASTAYTLISNAISAGLINNHTICVGNPDLRETEAFWRAVPNGVGCSFLFVGLTPGQYNAKAKSLADRYQAEFNNSPTAYVFEAYDSVGLVADAIQQAGSTDSAAVVKALEKTTYVGAQGQYAFPYGSSNPVPAGQPGWMWHQWMNPSIQMLEYTKANQTLSDAVALWPKARQTTPGTAYVPVTR
jgi:branched-chain amino acid transport system substrate-binding protein